MGGKGKDRPNSPVESSSSPQRVLMSPSRGEASAPEIVVKCYHSPSESAVITLGEDMESLAAFRAVCEDILGFEVGRVVDGSGHALTDVRQLVRRGQCYILRKGDSWKGRPEDRGRVLLLATALLFALLALGLVWGRVQGGEGSGHEGGAHPAVVAAPELVGGESAGARALEAREGGGGGGCDAEEGGCRSAATLAVVAVAAGNATGSTGAAGTSRALGLPEAEGAWEPPPPVEMKDPLPKPTGPVGSNPLREDSRSSSVPAQSVPELENATNKQGAGEEEGDYEEHEGAVAVAAGAGAEAGAGALGGTQEGAEGAGAEAEAVAGTVAGTVAGGDAVKTRRKAGRPRPLGRTVLVEHGRHLWDSNSLFSWQVLGSATEKLGLKAVAEGPNATFPMAARRPPAAPWHLLFCLTEECTGVPWWKWPNSFLTLQEGQVFNHLPGVSELCGREFLFRNVEAMRERVGETFHIMPDTYMLGGGEEEAAAGGALDAEFRAHFKAHSPGSRAAKPEVWILKNLTAPASLRPPMFGEGKLLVRSDQPEKLPQDGVWLAQRYVEDPYLINGRKFTIRLYVLITSVDPLRVYIYDEGIVTFAVDRYGGTSRDLSNLYAHLTNEVVASQHDLRRPPSGGDAAGGGDRNSRGFGSERRAAALEARRHKCVWTLKELRAYLLKEAGAGRPPVGELWEEIEELAVRAVLSAEGKLVKYSEQLLKGRGRTFELLGMDVLLDRHLRPWLLKLTDVVPNLQAETTLKYGMKESMMKDVLRTTGVVPFARDKYKADFEARLEAMVAQGYPASVADVAELQRTEDELRAGAGSKGRFHRVFPSLQAPDAHGNFWAANRPLNVMLHRWLEVGRLHGEEVVERGEDGELRKKWGKRQEA